MAGGPFALTKPKSGPFASAPSTGGMFERLNDWWDESTFFKPAYESLVSGATLPGDVYRGGVSREEIADRVSDLAGMVSLGAGAIPAEANALRSGLSSEAFRNWFGAGKVVDADGEPLTVFHATSADFDAFDPNAAGRGLTFLGFNADGAMRGASAGTWDNARGGPDRVMPLYVKAERINGVDLSKDEQAFIDALPERLSDAEYERLRAENPKMSSALSTVFDDWIETEQGWFGRRAPPPTLQDVLASGRDRNGYILPGYNSASGDQNAAARLRAQGFDATLVSDESGVALAVIDPTQIKSVHNRGTFNPKDPRILYGMAGGLGMYGASDDPNSL